MKRQRKAEIVLTRLCRKLSPSQDETYLMMLDGNVNGLLIVNGLAGCGKTRIVATTVVATLLLHLKVLVTCNDEGPIKTIMEQVVALLRQLSAEYGTQISIQADALLRWDVDGIEKYTKDWDLTEDLTGGA